MAWSDKSTLSERFQAIWHLLGRRRKGKTYRGFAQALRRHSSDLFERIDPHLRAQMQALAGDDWLIEGLCAFAADGSQFDCPRTKANLAGLGSRGKDPLRASLYVTGLYHLGLAMPWDWRVGPARQVEYRQILEMLADLPAGALLVMDAGLNQYELLRDIGRSGRHFLVRVGSNVHLLKDLGARVDKKAGRVWLWPSRERKGPPVEMYLYKVGSKRNRVWLVSDLPLSKKQVEVLYRKRWGIEIGKFRALKQTMDSRKVLSRSPDLAQWELHWAITGLWVLTLMGVQGLRQARKKPQRLSLAQVLRTVRAASQGYLCGKLWPQLGRATKDRYVRRGPKRSRRWPRQKDYKPAGKPHIRSATAAERQKAQAICARLAAG